RQRLSSSRRANGGLLGARDASQACVGVDAGRPCSVQTIETVCDLRTQGSTGVELGTLRPSTSGSLAAGSHLPRPVGFGAATRRKNQNGPESSDKDRTLPSRFNWDPVSSDECSGALVTEFAQLAAQIVVLSFLAF